MRLKLTQRPELLVEAPWNCPEEKNRGEVKRDRLNDWLLLECLYGSTVRSVQLRGTQSAQEGFYILSGDVENDFCWASPEPLASHTHKRLSCSVSIVPFYCFILETGSLFLLLFYVLLFMTRRSGMSFYK